MTLKIVSRSRPFTVSFAKVVISGVARKTTVSPNAGISRLMLAIVFFISSGCFFTYSKDPTDHSKKLFDPDSSAPKDMNLIVRFGLKFSLRIFATSSIIATAEALSLAPPNQVS